MTINRYAQRDAVLMEMGFSSYREYLRSPLYSKIKARIFRHFSTCVCGAEATQLHHKSYKKRYLLGRGKLQKFVVPLCASCHKKIEFNPDGTKRPLGEANEALAKITADAEACGFRLPPKVRLGSKSYKKALVESKENFLNGKSEPNFRHSERNMFSCHQGCVTFGLHKGKRISEIPDSYLEWMLRSFTDEAWRSVAAAEIQARRMSR